MTDGRLSFYKEILVPTGQLSLVLSRLAMLIKKKRPMAQAKSTGLSELSNQLFEFLHLVNVFASTRANMPDDFLDSMRTYRDLLAKFLTVDETTNPLRHGYLCLAFRHTSGTRSKAAAQSHALALLFESWSKELDVLLKTTLPPVKQVVYASMGYVANAEAAKAWLAKNLNLTNPLTQAGQLNRWRTLVRNTPWDTALQLTHRTLGFDVRAVELARDSRESHIGRVKAQKFYASLEKGEVKFPASTTMELRQDASVLRQAEAEQSDRLPSWLSLRSNAQGVVEVTRAHSPREVLAETFQQELSKLTEADAQEVQVLMKDTRETLVVGWLAIPATVVESFRWHRNLTQSIQDEVARVLVQDRARRKVELAARLKNEFSSEELALMQELFVKDGSSV
jgi:hypothetical protein